MFHRIRCENNYIPNIYDKRCMVHQFEEIIDLIDLAIKKGNEFGSIAQALEDNNTIHISFDDGYKEHLWVAQALKQRYKFSFDTITFSINIKNSFYDKKLCMDILYEWIETKNFKPFEDLFDMKPSDIDVNVIKKKIFTDKKYISLLNRYYPKMQKYFLDELEVIELSKLFSIGSHCINHFFLTSLDSDEVYNELNQSKRILESKLQISIDTICYPEGKSSGSIEKIAKSIGYKFGLSISGNKKLYKIKRVIPRCIL